MARRRGKKERGITQQGDSVEIEARKEALVTSPPLLTTYTVSIKRGEGRRKKKILESEKGRRNSGGLFGVLNIKLWVDPTGRLRRRRKKTPQERGKGCTERGKRTCQERDSRFTRAEKEG